ncbi:sensor histidine kinase [Bordetella avium]|uniref:sensor histidine kinase n=1 Tax=Bordetella avium TaxID=521 RepID=UPI000E69C4FE|nr:7TM diverse intracellular signaling domain-containing protein [Bordetella avium]RIQ37940.1 histidine kinase [Bordetella avium]RIQ41768.1 histidine kinase [Bordetella avium]RIQ43556.1 histidine kinase [Bordetella avium]RIQ48731.1 histidine kinase [Bordetella avium]RIQ58275.1 histidine kinase [Bordetella avium]
MKTLLALCCLLSCLVSARVLAASECSADILRVAAAQAAEGQMPSQLQTWQTVTLPDAWRSRWPDYRGSVWYRIEWQSHCGAALGLLLPAIKMAGEVYSNDDLLWRDASLVEPLSRSWNMPRYWVLPASSLHKGVNTLWVRVVGRADFGAGLGPVHIGPAAQIQALYDDTFWRQRSRYILNLVVSLSLSGLFFCVWVVRRSQRDYGWYAFCTLCWALFVANVLMTSPWPFADSAMALRANTMALVLYVAGFCMFTWHFGGQSLPRIERALWACNLGLLALLALAPDAYLVPAVVASVVLPSFVFFANCIQFPFHAWKTREPDHLIMAACLLVFLVAGVHDFLSAFGLIQTDTVYTPFTSIAATLSMAAVLGMRISRNISKVERFNQELAQSVQQARAELRASLALEHSLALANARLQDRLQLAHDLHDGPGGSVVRMMALVEQTDEPLRSQQVLSILRQIRDDLRQTIDSGASEDMPVPASPGEWIAPLRHRFTVLFEALDIAVSWEIASAWAQRPDAKQCLALTRLLEESLTNVVKHSQANKVKVVLRHTAEQGLMLSVEDDGVGFDVQAVLQSGLSVGMRSMQARIARVGGFLELASRPGHTLLTASLPPVR